MDIMHLRLDNPNYPSQVKKYLGERIPKNINTLGNTDILHHKKFALFCSVKCPGNLILQTYDLAQNLRQAGITVISGFHSQMESVCGRHSGFDFCGLCGVWQQNGTSMQKDS